MSSLPPPIAAYFRAERNDDDDALASCFRSDGIVSDEAHEHHGHDAIKSWRSSTRENTPFTSRIVDWQSVDDRAVVSTEVTGSFPNSPVLLEQTFTLDGNHIRKLEIR